MGFGWFLGHPGNSKTSRNHLQLAIMDASENSHCVLAHLKLVFPELASNARALKYMRKAGGSESPCRHFIACAYDSSGQAHMDSGKKTYEYTIKKVWPGCLVRSGTSNVEKKGDILAVMDALQKVVAHLGVDHTRMIEAGAIYNYIQIYKNYI